MKNTDLRNLIAEELENYELSLITEKFGSKIVAGVWKKMSKSRYGDADADLFDALAGSYSIAWDQIQDEHVSTDGPNPRRGMLNIFYVAKGTKNPYDDGYYGSDDKTFWRDMFLGATIGKKMIGITSGRNRYTRERNPRKVSTELKGNERFGSGQDEKIWNYKRLAEVATEVYTIDLLKFQDFTKELKAARAEQKEGAMALKGHKEILQQQKGRYKDAINKIRTLEVQGKEEKIVGDMVLKAQETLVAAMEKRIADLKSNTIYRGWDNPFSAAQNFYNEMLRTYENMLRDIAAHEKAKERHKDAPDGDGKWDIKYYGDRVTQAAKDAQSHLKDFEKKMANIEKLQAVQVSESVLPVNEVAPIAAAIGRQVVMSVAADKIADKVSKNEQVETEDIVELAEGASKMYEEDEDESHTSEGYMKEMYEKMYENWKKKIGKAVGDAATQAVADVAADTVKKKIGGAAKESFSVNLETDLFLLEGKSNISKRFLQELENRNITFEKVNEGCGCNGTNESISCVNYKGSKEVLEAMINELWVDDLVEESLKAITEIGAASAGAAAGKGMADKIKKKASDAWDGAKKMVGLGEGKAIEPKMMVEIIKENCEMYAADDDESHTAEGYIKEVSKAMNEMMPKPKGMPELPHETVMKAAGLG
jgi:hypothetical protein